MNKHLLLFLLHFLFINLNSQAQTYGCTDPLANNYNVAATHNDGSCLYNAAAVAPISSFNLNSALVETSGLIRWNNWAWTHNDSQDTLLYALDTLNGNIVQTYPLPGVINRDWEEISQDDNYVYVGDFGNNANGNRTNLKIIRIDKTSLLANSPVIDTIAFSYSNQTVFTPQGADNTDFDCEAFIVTNDSIYLFTKQWISNETGVYALPKIPGTYVANLKFNIDVQGLVTGVTFLESRNVIVLSGYSSLVQPFMYLLYDFNGKDFFNGNKRKLDITLPFHQVEGITTSDGLKYYVSNEFFAQPPIFSNPQMMHIFDLSPFLESYLDSTVSVPELIATKDFKIYPIPSSDFLTIESKSERFQSDYTLINHSGQLVLTGKLSEFNQAIDISALPSGIYVLNLGRKRFNVVKR